MKYTVNGEPRESGPLTIANLAGDQPGIAVAVNGRVVSRSAWDRQIVDNDVIDILTAVQGG